MFVVNNGFYTYFASSGCHSILPGQGGGRVLGRRQDLTRQFDINHHCPLSKQKFTF
jgi:hypothetical protein